MPTDGFWSVSGQATWPRDLPGYVFLGRAADSIGRALCGEKWSLGDMSARPIRSRILDARPVNPSKSVSSDCVRTTSQADLLLRRLRGDMPRPPRAVGTPLPSLTTESRPSYLLLTDEEWEAALAAAREEEASSLKAVERANLVRTLIADAAYGKQFTIVYREEGRMVETKPHWWNTDKLAPRFAYCRVNPKHPITDGVGGDSFCEMFVTDGDLRSFVGTLPHARLMVNGVDLGQFSPYLRFAVGLAEKWKSDADWSAVAPKMPKLIHDVQEEWKDAHGTELKPTPAEYIARILKFPQEQD